MALTLVFICARNARARTIDRYVTSHGSKSSSPVFRVGTGYVSLKDDILRTELPSVQRWTLNIRNNVY